MSFTTTNRLSLRRRVLFGTTLLALGGFLATGVASCVTLPDIDSSKCGNFVVEPENGEACDEDTERCGLPSSIGACRFLCDYQDAAGIQCPTGLGCGLDGVCRKSDGLTDSPISIGGGGIQKLMNGDFDGDGRMDVVAVGFSTAEVHFLTTEGNIERTVTLPNEMGLPGVGDVNGDQLSDIVLSLNRAVGVLLGQEDRSFAPQSYTAMFVAPKTQTLAPLGAYTTDGVILAFTDVGGDTSVEFITLNADGGHDRTPATDMPVPGSLVGAVATKGMTISNVPCGIAAFEVSAKGILPARVVVGSRCGMTKVVSSEIPLPGMDPWGGAYFAKKDNDDFSYLFFGVSNGNPSLKVIKTYINGQAAPPENFLDFEAGNCIESVPSLASAPLAVGDLNGDSYPDFVDSRGVLFYNPNNAKKFTRICHSYSYTDPTDLEKTPVSWTHAVIGDFNGDGLSDVLGSRVSEGVLDLWTWQPGGFNTIPIFVGGRVDELVTGDFDGDAIADAAFRFAAPSTAMGMGGKAPPTPLFAMFGNPLSLPSPPQPLGFLEGMQHIAAGRIKGANSAAQPDILSDLVVLSAGSDPTQPMPLTLFQGNVTRNLVAPLCLQQDSTKIKSDSMATDQVFGVFISEFGVSACDRFNSPTMTMTDTPPEPSSIIALGSSGRIWLAGCKADGSSLPTQQEKDKLNLDDVSFLFAPVDRSSNDDALAVFMSNPPFKDSMGMGMDPPPRSLGLGTIEYQGATKFSDLPLQLSGINSGIQLPKEKKLDMPFAFADLDHNGLRDVILTGKTGTQRKIFIFWNGDANDLSGNIIADPSAITEFDFNPNAQPSRSNNKGRADDTDIMDVAGINFDDDHFGELAILTQEHVYIAKLTQKVLTDAQKEKGMPLELETGRTLGLLFGDQAFADIRGGQALLSIDANSDGIEDLIVADSGKLLLYIGTERLK